jgi:5-methyltetrahydrofolate--homocysteine methyltransferase
MKTVIKSESKTVCISPDDQVVLVGEKINPTGRKKLPEALLAGDYDYVLKVVAEQVTGGANVLDVNVGAPGVDEEAVLPEIVKLVASVTDLPLCVDTANPKALAAALKVAPGRPLVNSVNGETISLANVLPLVHEHQTAVIGLTIDDDGISTEPEKRLKIAEKIVNEAVKIGIAAEDVVIDPLVMTVGSDGRAAVDTLETIALIREKLGVNIALGASNVSFGMPDRHTLNQSFMTLAIANGANCMITDASRLGLTVRAAEMLLNRDDYGRNYLGFYRNLEKRKKALAAA